MIVTLKDFQGFHKIASDCYTDVGLQSYIDKFEDLYLCMLMGDELMMAFNADLVDGVPQDPRFIAIYNKFCKVLSDCGCNEEKFISCGLKDMIACLIFYHFVIEQHYQNTITGTVINSNATSKPASAMALIGVAERRFNLGVDTFKAIRACFLDDKELYPEYAGCDICYKFHPFM